MFGSAVKMKTFCVVTCSIIVLGIFVDVTNQTTHGPHNEIGDKNPSCSRIDTASSICVAPDTVKCKDGYYIEVMGDDDLCKPHCNDCINGNCTKPDKCECHDGYIRVNSRCEPDCGTKCANGKCIRPPDVCHCFEGFKLNTTTMQCEPRCNQGCPLHSTCVAPNDCTCEVGYVYVYSKEDYQYICKPHCDDCSHGDCIAPGKCPCKEGYKEVNSRCVPVCKHECVNGYCVGPDKCNCYEGFYKPNLSMLHDCHPICGQECINSTCVAPNECKCKDGYVYVYSEDSYTCKPHCDDCSHGDCIAPGDCRCKEGYKEVNSRCVPVCKPECVNGYCFGPDKCDCYEHFIRNASIPHVCHPNCDPECINSTCVAPNKCKCKEGYVTVENTCKPHCDDCSHGDCVAPGDCRCKGGYKEVNSRCEPKCKYDCKHGRCIAPEDCLCNEGYRKDDYSCIPSCEPDCINGLCEAPNQCRCKKGTWKAGASYCTLKCSEFPFDKKCYNSSHVHVSPFKYTLNEDGASFELSSNDSISIQVAFEHFPERIISGYLVMDFLCFTDLQAEEDGAVDIVCSPAYDAAQCYSVEEGGSPVSLISSVVKTVDLVFLHRNTSNLRNAHICQTSNRVFHIKGTSKLSLCLKINKLSDEEYKGDILTSSLALYSIIAIVVASAVGYITAKWVSRKKLDFKRADPISVSHRPLIESESELGEIGPQALEYIDISDKLDDLK